MAFFLAVTMFQLESLDAYVVPYKIDTLGDCRGNPNCPHLPVKMFESPKNQDFIKVRHAPISKPKKMKVFPPDHNVLTEQKQLDDLKLPEKFLPIKPQTKSSPNQVKCQEHSKPKTTPHPKRDEKVKDHHCSKCNVHKQIVNIALPVFNKNKPRLSKDSPDDREQFIPYVISLNSPDNLDF